MAIGTNEESLRTAIFDKDAIIKYHRCGLWVLVLFIITIPIAIVMAIIYKLVLSRVIDSWECTLTSRALHVKKGIFTKIEKTVPLEKITDLQMMQSWLMRRFGLYRISVETAGQSGPGSLISLMGITDTEAFRQAVLDQRDTLSKNHASGAQPAGQADGAASAPVLAEIRDSLARTEDLLRELVEKS